MAENRRLAAIMFTDIVGYTALMGSDEDRAFDVLSRNREIHIKLIEQFNGTLIKEMGDGMLISFNLASDAVRCAIEIQKECKKQNIPLKIGIHEGEMVFTCSDVHGDGVNIASRIQDSTAGGCISISESVYRDIKNKTSIDVEFMEEKRFKNVHDPIKIYQVFCDNDSPSIKSSVIVDANVLEKKSIIVLPFVNMSPDPDQEYFSDGLTEEIITDLSFIEDLLVISRSSAMTFKGTKQTIKDIAGKVNVRYVLEGSVRKSSNNLRITAQLINAENDTHIWAKKYNGTLEDIFDIQEKVSSSIAKELKIKLSTEEKMRIQERPINNVFAYDCYKRAYPEMMSMSKERLDHGLNLLKKGLDIGGENALIYAGMAFAYFQYVNLGFDHEKNIKKAEEFIQKSFNLDHELAEAHFVLGLIYVMSGKIDKAIHSLTRAHAGKPEDPEIMVWLALLYSFIGIDDSGKSLINRCVIIDPINPLNDSVTGWNHFFGGRFDLALDPLLAAYNLTPESGMNQFWKSLVLFYNDRAEEAYKFIYKFVEEPGTDTWTKLAIFLKYILKREKDKLPSLLTSDFIKSIQIDGQNSYHIATFYSYLGEKEKSLEWLENAVGLGLINYPLLSEHDKLLNNIRGEPRFKKLMKKVKIKWENFEV